MKKTFNLMMTAVLCLSSVIALSSCSKDDLTTDYLEGKWNLTHFVEYSFRGEIIASGNEEEYLDSWIAFDFSDNSVLVTFDDSESASFSYFFTGERLVIMGGDYAFKKISNNEFAIASILKPEYDIDLDDYTEYTTYKGKVIYRHNYFDDDYCYEDNGNYYYCGKIGDDFYDQIWLHYNRQ